MGKSMSHTRERKIISDSSNRVMSALFLNFLSVYDGYPINFIKRARISSVVPIIDEVISKSLKKVWHYEKLYSHQDKLLLDTLERNEHSSNNRIDGNNNHQLAEGSTNTSRISNSQNADIFPIMRISRSRGW